MERMRKAASPARKNGFFRLPRKPLTRGIFILMAMFQVGEDRLAPKFSQNSWRARAFTCAGAEKFGLLYYIRFQLYPFIERICGEIQIHGVDQHFHVNAILDADSQDVPRS